MQILNSAYRQSERTDVKPTIDVITQTLGIYGQYSSFLLTCVSFAYQHIIRYLVHSFAFYRACMDVSLALFQQHANYEDRRNNYTDSRRVSTRHFSSDENKNFKNEIYDGKKRKKIIIKESRLAQSFSLSIFLPCLDMTAGNFSYRRLSPKLLQISRNLFDPYIMYVYVCELSLPFKQTDYIEIFNQQKSIDT